MTKLMVELESKGQVVQLELHDPSIEKLVQMVKHHFGDSNTFVFEKDKDGPLDDIGGRTAISVVAHRCRRVSVTVNFEHHSETETFSPSATIFRVLRWAVGHKVFNLDETARAKANLMISGQEAPLPRDDSLAKYVLEETCSLTLELTLKDFTNGYA